MNRPSVPRVFKSLVLAGSLSLSAPLLTACDDSGLPPPEADERAVTILRDTIALIREADTATFTMVVRKSLPHAGAQPKSTETYTIMFERPNRFAFIPRDGAENMVISDGEKLYVWMPARDEYAVTEAPATMEEILRVDMGLVMSNGPVTKLLPLLLSDDGLWDAPEVPDLWLRHFRRLAYEGPESLEGPAADYHHLRILYHSAKDAGFDRALDLPMDPAIAASRTANDVWINAGGQPLVHRIDSDAFSAHGLRLSVRFADWRVREALPDNAFSFTAPDDAVRVDRIPGFRPDSD